MTDFYSEVFASANTAAAVATAPEAGYMAPAGLQGYPKKIARLDLSGAAAVAALADNDVFVLQPVDPRERLLSLVVTAGATFNGSSTITIDFGLYKLNADRSVGAVLDLDLFASLVDVKTTAIARVDEFTESTSLVNLDRGKRIWELADVTLTLDPLQGRGETWAICGQFNLGGTCTAGAVIQVETELLPV